MKFIFSLLILLIELICGCSSSVLKENFLSDEFKGKEIDTISVISKNDKYYDMDSWYHFYPSYFFENMPFDSTCWDFPRNSQLYFPKSKSKENRVINYKLINKCQMKKDNRINIFMEYLAIDDDRFPLNNKNRESNPLSFINIKIKIYSINSYIGMMALNEESLLIYDADISCGNHNYRFWLNQFFKYLIESGALYKNNIIKSD